MEDQPQLQANRLIFEDAGERQLDELTLTLKPGQIVVLLGTNGAGKSTLMNILAGVLTPCRGEVLLDGKTITGQSLARRRIGYLPDRPPLYDELSVDQQLAFAAAIFCIEKSRREERREAVIRQWQLEERRSQSTSQLSKGWRQRCGLAQTMIHEPDYLLLDEPGEGLDPPQLLHLREQLRQLAIAGTGILLSTHLLEEARQLADEVVFLHRGRIHQHLTAKDIALPGELERRFTELLTGLAA